MPADGARDVPDGFFLALPPITMGNIDFSAVALDRGRNLGGPPRLPVSRVAESVSGCEGRPIERRIGQHQSHFTGSLRQRLAIPRYHQRQ